MRQAAVVKFFQHTGLILVVAFIFSASLSAQVENPKTRERVAPKNETKTDSTVDAAKNEEVKPNEQKLQENQTDDKTVSPQQTVSQDEEAVLTYYNNYLKEYRLGPSDVISVEVFGQCPDYCKLSITVPPTARISYPLIKEGVLVGGRTVEQVAEEITKKLDEYIIDPKVTVTLDKAMSARYSVMGKVGAPGIRIMDRKVSLYEAVIEAGGIAKEGNKKKIALVRFDPQGKLTRQEVNLSDIESGKAPMIYLNPGDQVFVPGKGFTIDTVFKALERVSLVRLLFGSPF
jgi:polysaccharide biosynthesis/export protein